jgi:hypothetical protein
MAFSKHGSTDSIVAAPTARVVARDPVGQPVRRALGSGRMAKASLLGCLLAAVALVGCSDDGSPWPKLAAIPLANPEGYFWGAKLSVGGQSFLVQADTGSATTALAGASCATCASVGVSPLYMPGATAKDDRLTTGASYGDMSGWSGEIYTDRISLGNGTPSLSFPIGDISTNLMEFFQDNGYQGILGIGPPESGLPDTGAYFDLAEQSGAVPVMAFELCPTGGTMWIGGFDPTRAAAAPAYTPMLPITDHQRFYAVDVHSMSIGSTRVASAADFHSSAGPPIVDTGTTLFIAPDAVVSNTLAAVNGAPGFKALFGNTAKLGTVDSADNNGCVTKAGVTAAMVDAMLPALTLTFPGTLAGASDLSFTVKPTVSYMLDVGSDSWCFGIVNSADGSTILGDAILQAFVTIIDLQNQQVGWAPDLGCTLDTQRRAIERTAFHPHPPRPRPQRRR